MKSEILKHFEDMEDHRVAGWVIHPLRIIIFITVVGALCGLTGWEEIADFAKYRKGFFSKYIDISMGLPCEDTLRRDADLSFEKLPCCRRTQHLFRPLVTACQSASAVLACLFLRKNRPREAFRRIFFKTATLAVPSTPIFIGDR